MNAQGHAVLRVDDTNAVVYNDKRCADMRFRQLVRRPDRRRRRYSVRIESSELYSIGSVFVMDAGMCLLHARDGLLTCAAVHVGTVAAEGHGC